MAATTLTITVSVGSHAGHQRALRERRYLAESDSGQDQTAGCSRRNPSGRSGLRSQDQKRRGDLCRADSRRRVGRETEGGDGFQRRSDDEQQRQDRPGGLDRVSADMQGTNDGWRTKKSSTSTASVLILQKRP
jgi:hypothetical protein